MAGQTQKSGGFTVVEMIIVIVVLGILAAIVYSNFISVKNNANEAQAAADFHALDSALEQYNVKYEQYPADIASGLPSGLNEFLSTSDSKNFPDGPWSGSTYNYNRWTIDSTDTIQVSLRFCDSGGHCQFPGTSWAKNFGVDSAYYFCVKGNCRASQNQPASYPGYCVNCPGHKAIGS